MTTSLDAKLWPQWSPINSSESIVKVVLSELQRALPCHVVSVSGSLVTVAFDVANPPIPLPQVTVPKAEGMWLRSPTQIGDRGIVLAADAYLEPIAGMASGTAPFTRPSTYGGLAFMPVSQQPSPPDDPNASYVQGPNGFVGQTTTGTKSSVITDSNGTTITFGGVSLTISSSGVRISGGNLTVDEDATIKGIQYSTHVHSGVASGSSVSGAPQG